MYQEYDNYENKLTSEIIGACIEVHKELGPGLLEAVYEDALCLELENRELLFERQVVLPVYYKGIKLNSEYRADLIIENQVLIELKAVK
jgi:GxxExxY protein